MCVCNTHRIVQICIICSPKAGFSISFSVLFQSNFYINLSFDPISIGCLPEPGAQWYRHKDWSMYSYESPIFSPVLELQAHLVLPGILHGCLGFELRSSAYRASILSKVAISQPFGKCITRYSDYIWYQLNKYRLFVCL